MTKLMGILNLTDKALTKDKAIEMGNQMFEEGADLLDIGAKSQRFGLTPFNEQEELERLIPVIQVLGKSVDIPISINTFFPKVAERAIESGASYINDSGGFASVEMIEVAKTSNAYICLTHSIQNKENGLQPNAHYPDGVVTFLLHWFQRQIDELLNQGIKEKQIIIDPGIGLGKTVADNVEIIQNLHKFKELKFPLLVGASRKSFLGQSLNKSTEELLPATLVVNTLAVLAKADILRVHDIKEHRDMLAVLEQVL